MLSYVQTIPNSAKLQKCSNHDENDKKCWVTFKPFQTQAKLQKWSNYDENDQKFSVTSQTIRNSAKLQK